MKISYLAHKTMDIDPKKLNIICTSSPIVFYEFISSFQGNSDSIEYISDDFKRLEANKIIDWLEDPILNSHINEKYMTKIYTKMVSDLTDAQRTKIFHKWDELKTLVQEELFMSDLPLEVAPDLDLKKLFKFSDLKLVNSAPCKPYGIIENVIKIHQCLNLETILVFCNLSHYLDNTQILELKKLVEETGQGIITLEYNDKSWNCNKDMTNFYYIDKDLVDFY
ncbi:type II-A CRISPR-associated protein Csn2 [Lactobacillus corticis]|uniref:CRISPR-associated protein Csn2 n=1 Tax=Lactobacillus corticis TaxID=2201249 RepID=A0A916VJE3_9LACO|nr:type II-A CRISPR-associated protein Csn2 [Lactobacillus corticis]GFZ27779.1 CRISPR-associated protein Csn2 [Lactobacillus corticis]